MSPVWEACHVGQGQGLPVVHNPVRVKGFRFRVIERRAQNHIGDASASSSLFGWRDRERA